MKSRKVWLVLAFALIIALVGVLPVFAASTVTESDWKENTPNPLVKCAGGDCDHKDCDYVYSFAVVGDTQNLNYTDAKNFVEAQKKDPSLTYADYDEAYMRTLYNWILSHKDSLNIQYVMGVGDITQSFGSSQTYYQQEWPLAKEAISLLDGKLGYSLVRGNHDISSGLNGQFGVGSTYYNDLVALSKTTDAQGRPMGGFRLADKIEDSYRKIVAGGNKYIIFTVEYYATEETVTWMNELLAENSDYTAIVTLHAFLNRDTTFVDLHETTTPEEDAANNNWKETATGGMVSPRQLWERVLSKHANVQMVLSGHIDEDNVLVNAMQGDKGNTVTFMLTDTQTIDSTTPVGVVTMLYFTADGKVAHVEHISTVRDAAGQPAYLRDVNQFTLDLDYEWTETKYGKVPTAEYEANTFHILLDDDGIADNDSFYYGSYNTWNEVIAAIYPWTGVGSAEARSLKQYNVLMTKDYTHSVDAANTITNNTRSIVSLDLNGHTLTCSKYLYRVYNKFSTYPPTIELKNGNVIQSSNNGLVVTQLSTKADGTHLTVNLENLNVSYNGGTACIVGYYNGYNGYNSTVDVNVTNCTIDTTGADGKVTLFKLDDAYENTDTTLTLSGVTIKGTTAANTIIYSANGDTVKALPDNNGNALTVSLTEKVAPTGLYRGTEDSYYVFGTPTEADGRYAYSLSKSQLESTAYGPIDATAYPESDYPFALFNDYGFVKAYKTYLAFLQDIPTSVKSASTLLVRADWNTTDDGKASGNLGKLTAPLTIDLNGKTAHRGSYHLLQMMGYGTDYSVTVKNGTLTYANALVAFNNNGSTTNKETITLRFENVTFAPTAGKNLIISYKDGSAGMKANVTFDNCTFDLTKHTSSVVVFSLADSESKNWNDITVTINGGQFKAKTYSQTFTTVDAAREDNATPDKLIFGQYKGEYTKFSATTTSSAPAISPVNDKGETMMFDNIGADSAPIYRLVVPTKYGLIPYKWENVTDYPFVIFKKGEDVASYATASWKSIMAEAVKYDGCTILLRRDYNVSEGTYYVAEANASITMDLGGFEISNSGYMLAYYGNTAADTTFSITVKNGTFNQKAKQPFINVDYSAAALYKTINLAFIDMTVKSTYTSTNWSILANYSNTKANFNGKVSVTLTDCIVDFTGTTKKSNLIHAGSTAGADNAEFTININGGKFIADNIANYTIYGIAERDIINFGVGKDGKYSVLVTNTTPTIRLETNTLKVGFFKATSVAGEYVLDFECKHSYDAVVTAPTCTDEGYTTHSCIACGDSYVDTKVSAIGHSYTDDLDADCNRCGEVREVEEAFELKANLTLGSEIRLNFYTPVGGNIASIAVNGNVLTAIGTTTIGGKSYTVYSYDGIAPSRAMQTLILTVAYTVEQGGETVTKSIVRDYSVIKYAKAVLTDNTVGAEGQAVVRDLLGFVKAAYEYFGNDAATAEEIAFMNKLCEDYPASSVDAIPNSNADPSGISDVISSAQFMLSDGVIKLVLNVKDSTRPVTVSVKGATLLSVGANHGEDRLIVELRAYQLCDTLTVTSGANVGTYGFLEYAEGVMGTDAKLDAMLKAMYAYSVSALKYKSVQEVG